MLKGLLIVLGIGALLWALSQRHRFLAVASAMRQAVGQQTPPPTGGTPAGHWWERTLVRWGFGIVGGAILIALVPGEWRNPLLKNWDFWFVVGAIMGYGLFARAVNPRGWDDQSKKHALLLARVVLAVALLGIGARFAKGQGWGPDGELWQEVSTKLDDLTTPTPPPPVVWKGERVITLQPKGDWITVEVPWGTNQYGVQTGPNPTAKAEVFSPEWDRSWPVGGGDSKKLPWLPFDGELRFRSKEDRPITVKVMWR